MEHIVSLLAISNGTVVGLGVGSSTIVIVSFLVALWDGKIDVSERRMLGVVYWALRAAMVWILLTTALISYLEPDFFRTFTPFLWILIGVLYINAGLMTLHYISPKIGPAIQAGTWYTLGFLMVIFMLELYELTLTLFVALYLADVALALAAVNSVMWYRARRRITTQSE
jgi:hypothetical protein